MQTPNKSRTQARTVSGWTVLACAASLTAQEPAPPHASERFRVEVPVVNVYCTVKDKKGRLITDLAREEFELRENGKPEDVRYFAQETAQPLTLALLVDTSISQEHVLGLEKDTGALFLERILRPGDLAALISFDIHVDLLQDFTEETARLQRALERARINAPQALGPFPRSGRAGTRLYDALYLASADKLGREVGRKAIVVLSDGVDAGSQVKFGEALEAAQRSDVMIYALVVADPDYYRYSGAGYPSSAELEKFARETGGRKLGVVRPDREKLAAAFDAIAAELRSQYSLGYTPSDRTADGTFRKIEIKIKRKGLRVQARRGYYAPRAPATAAQ